MKFLLLIMTVRILLLSAENRVINKKIQSKMKKTFILFRHGQTDYNLCERLHGQLDIPLNETGKEQAAVLAEKLKNYRMQVIYTSPLKRAVQTAQIVGSLCGVRYGLFDNLQEANFGEAEGMMWADVKKKYPHICKTLFTPNVRMSDRFPGGESKEEITDRMFAAMIELTDIPENIIGISSHGAIISRFLQALGRGDKPLDNAEFFIVEYDDGKFIWKK